MAKLKLFLCAGLIIASGFTVFSQTSDWRKYSSSMAGFKVNFPPDWRVEKEEGKGRVWRLTIISPGVRDDDVFIHSSITICSKPKSDSFETLDRCSEHHLPISHKKIISENKFTLNGVDFHRIETEDTYRPHSVFFVSLFSTPSRDFQIAGYFSKQFDLDRYIPVFDKLLTTFHPLQEASVLTFKNETYDFAITYPASWKSCPVDPKASVDEERLLTLVPKGQVCNGVNYIAVSRMTRFSSEKNNRDLKGFLEPNNFPKIIPYLAFGNIHAAMGERTDKKYIYRERYFYTNYPQTYELLKISEMFGSNRTTLQSEAEEILKTARRFLKFQ